MIRSICSSWREPMDGRRVGIVVTVMIHRVLSSCVSRQQGVIRGKGARALVVTCGGGHSSSFKNRIVVQLTYVLVLEPRRERRKT
ncbi:multidrug oligosaccharidyl-lipid polysaccharide flippase [Moniliophthora roreri]|nr:multidrug oligosaccharidyl-lipid polysaccharide flippase [Moniliophthora roreri]